MPRHVFSALVSVLACLGPQTVPSRPPATTHVVYANATGANRATVTDLTASEVIVKEDGTVRDVLSVEPATGELQIVILVDDSGTGVFRYGLTALAQRLQGKAQITIRVVANQVQTLVDSTTDVDRWLMGMSRLGVRPATPEGGLLLDGIYEAARDLRRQETRRPVIVALTVGGEEQSPRLAGQVLDELSRSRASLHVIFVDTPATRPQRAIAKPSDLLEDTFNLSRVLSSGPKESGGRRRDVLGTGVQQVEVQQVAQDLLSQYAITYARPGTGNPRRLQVTSTRPGVTMAAPTRIPLR
jgi:hypothetical protein